MVIYNNIDVKFILRDKRKITNWIKSCIKEEKYNLAYISFNLCSDDCLLKLNIESLQHDYYTDIITFELNEKEEPIEGDLYISIDRIKENALKINTEFTKELYRVIIHGVLHLCGYKDKTKKDIKLMRLKENYYLNKL